MSLVLEGVAKRVGVEDHIHPTDLRLEAGTMNVLLGPTLAGKTSLMRLMAGLDRPTEGRVLWQDEDVTGRRVQDRNIAMVYQQFINYPAMTVYENIASPLRLMRVAPAEIDRRVRDVAHLMKLDDRQLARRPLELSGGQQQRCALARALVKKAGLVLLDEPLANLDYKLREELRAEIPRIFAESGAIFVYATTEPHEALLLGGNTACMWEGRVTQFGPTPEVYRRPADATTARVFSDPPMNFAPLAKAGSEIRYGEASAPAGPFETLKDGTYLAGFRPNHVHVEEPVPGALAFDVEVFGTEITGSESYIHISHGRDRWTALLHGVHHLPSGEAHRVYVDPAQVYLFDNSERLVSDASSRAA